MCSPAVVGFPISASWVQVSACMSVTPVMSYLSTGLAGCSVDPEISRGACKLARKPRVIKKKKKEKKVYPCVFLLAATSTYNIVGDLI